MGALQITIPRWNITEFSGYEPITTFWQDFSIADKFGNNAIADTYRGSVDFRQPYAAFG